MIPIRIASELFIRIWVIASVALGLFLAWMMIKNYNKKKLAKTTLFLCLGIALSPFTTIIAVIYIAIKESGRRRF